MFWDSLFHISKLSSKQIWFHFTVFVLIQKYYLLSGQKKHFSHWTNTSSWDCREADSRDTSPRHACLGEVTRKIWLHVFAINNNGGSVLVIFISLALLYSLLIRIIHRAIIYGLFISKCTFQTFLLGKFCPILTSHTTITMINSLK